MPGETVKEQHQITLGLTSLPLSLVRRIVLVWHYKLPSCQQDSFLLPLLSLLLSDRYLLASPVTAATFLETSRTASGSKTLRPTILLVTIWWRSLKVYGLNVSLVRPYESINCVQGNVRVEIKKKDGKEYCISGNFGEGEILAT